ncbi:MAG: glycosyltransferase [Alphaproteobacteria bacterium]
MAEPLTIVHVIANLADRLGGPVQACLGMAGAVAARGHRVSIHTTDWDVDGARRTGLETVDGVAIHRHRAILGDRWPVSPALHRALDRALSDADVAHVHSLYHFHDWSAARLSRRHGVAMIVRPHGTLEPYIRARGRLQKRIADTLFQRRALARAAAVHYTSAQEARLAADAVPGTPAAIVPLGIEAARYRALPPAGAFRARHRAIGGRRIVLFLGRLAEKKGLDLLVPAFARVADAHDLHLVLAGPDAGMGGAVAGWIEAHGLAGRTTVAGMVRGADKMALLADAWCFALPSYSENFAIAAAEAMGAGLPVLLSDRVGIAEEAAAAGAALVGPPSVETIAGQIATLAGDEGRARAMGAAGRALVAERFDWPVVACALEDLYRRVAGQPSP